MSTTISNSGSPAPNARSEDGHKGATSHSSRHRSRSRDKRRERSSSRHRSHRDKDRGDRERDRDVDPERRRSGRDDRDRDRDGHRRRRSKSYDRERERERERRRERDDRGERDHRRRKRDDSADAERHPDSKRRRDDSVEKKMDIDIEPEIKPKNGVPSPVSPAADSDRRERERRSPTASSRRSGKDRPELPSPRREGRDRDYDRDRRRPGPDFDDRRPRDRSFDREREPPYRPPPRVRRPSPGYEPRPHEIPPPDDDSEARSVFVSQLAARLTARDLGYFFEDKLGEGTVIDSRIVTDRVSRRSKGIAYVELASIDLVNKAIGLSGTVVMGLPIMVQLTESERNKVQTAGDSLNLPPGVNAPPVGMQLYVGSLHFNLTESDIKQVFEPFGELDFVDLHKDPQTGRSKGYAFVQYKRAEDAKMALEQMEGFELAGRQLRVNTVHEKGSLRGIITGSIQQDSLDEGGGTNLTNVSRQALMQKLARTEVAPTRAAPIMRPTNIPTTMKSRCILLKDMFNPEEETERDWHKELEADVKEECEAKYGPVEAIKVEVESQGEIYLKFDTVESATNAIDGLNGRWFGGRQVSAAYISEAIMQAHL